MNEELRKVQYELKKMQAIGGRVSDFPAYNRKLIELTKRNNQLVEQGRKDRADKEQDATTKAKIRDYLGTDPRVRNQWKG